MTWNVFLSKIQSFLCQPKHAQKVPEPSRNAPQDSVHLIVQWDTLSVQNLVLKVTPQDFLQLNMLVEHQTPCYRGRTCSFKIHPASRAFPNLMRKKGLCRNPVKSLLSICTSCCLKKVSNPGQVSITLLDAILIFALKARFWLSPCQKYDAHTA